MHNNRHIRRDPGTGTDIVVTIVSVTMLGVAVVVVTGVVIAPAVVTAVEMAIAMAIVTGTAAPAEVDEDGVGAVEVVGIPDTVRGCRGAAPGQIIGHT